MAFQVVDITDSALVEAEEYVCFIRDIKKQPDAAERWFRGLVESIYSLEEQPERSIFLIVLWVDRLKERVVVYRVYHGSRERLSQNDLS